MINFKMILHKMILNQFDCFRSDFYLLPNTQDFKEHLRPFKITYEVNSNTH